MARAQSNCRPAITVYNGLCVNIHPMDTNGDKIADAEGAALRVSDVLVRAVDASCAAPSPMKFALRKRGAGTGMPSDTVLRFSCDELGVQNIEVWVKDANQRMNYTETYVIVQANDVDDCSGTNLGSSTACPGDVLPPELLVFNGLSGTLRTTGAQQPALRMPASTFVRATYDNCGGPFQYRIRKSGTGAGVPGNLNVTFDCNDVGVQQVEIWAGDPNGNWSFCETFAVVQDIEDQCNFPTPTPTSCTVDEMPPELLVFSSLATELGSNLQTRVYAKDFVRVGLDKCQKFVQWRITKYDDDPDPGPKPPAKAADFVTFDCSTPGSQLVYIWFGDKAGNWIKAQAIAGIYGSFSGCSNNGFTAFDNTGARMDFREKARVSTPALSVRPNPVNDGFLLAGQLDQAGWVSLYLYDYLGRLVDVRAERQWMEAGAFQFRFERRLLPPGLYRCVVYSGDGVQMLPLVFQ